MAHKNDKDPIEEFFEKRLENFDISYMASDWEKLEAKLDVAATKRTGRRRMVWLAAASLLLFGSLGVFTYQNYLSINDLKQEILVNNEPNENPNGNLEENSPAINPNEDIAEPLARVEDNTNGNVVPPNTDVSQNNEVVQTGDDPIASLVPDRRHRRRSVGKKKTTPSSIPSRNCKMCAIDKNLMRSAKSATFAGFTIIDDEGPASESIFAANRTADFEVNQVTEPRALSRFSIGVSFGSDVTAVSGLSNFSTPGYSFGLKAEYNFTSRFSAIAGVQQMQIQYSAGRGQYSPPRGFWTNGVIANSTDAACRILDLSLVLKYNFIESTRSRFFATGGVSNNILLNEEYNFQYTTQDPSLIQEFDASSGTNDFINSASFSLGYEYDLDSRLGIRFEPSIRVPVNGIGFGSVNLYSLGTSISFRYRLRR